MSLAPLAFGHLRAREELVAMGEKNAGSPRRGLVFLFHDRDGVVDDSVVRVLKGLKEQTDFQCVVSNGPLQDESRFQLESLVDVVLERENIGFDVGAYKFAFDRLGWDFVSSLEELVLANSTFFGPVATFGTLFSRMGEQNVDFWGITDHREVTPHPYLGKGTMPRHLQSYWLTIGSRMLESPSFRRYWETLPLPRTYSEVVVDFETKFTRYFEDRGFSWGCAFPAEDYGVDNPAMEAPVALLQDGCPIFKKRLYFHDVPWLAQNGVFPGAVTSFAAGLGYPKELVVDGTCRRSTTRELMFALDATFVVPTHTKTASHSFPAVHVVGRPWKELAQRGVQEVVGDAEFLVVNAPDHPTRRDGNILSLAYAREAIVQGSEHLAELFEGNPRMMAVFPYTQILTPPEKGRAWVKRVEVASGVAKALRLSPPFSATSTPAPYRGIACYRRELVEEIVVRIQGAGGWDSLSSLVGSSEVLDQILDLLAGDVARQLSGFIGQVGTTTEVSRTAALVQDIYSRKPAVQPDYLDYPYSGRVILPSLKNRLGKRIEMTSPQLFASLYRGQQQLQRVAASLKPSKRNKDA